MRGQCLQNVCEKYDFQFWLASLERDDKSAWRKICLGKTQNPDNLDIQKVLKLALVVDQRESTIVCNAPVAECDIIQRNPFADDPIF